MRWRMKLMRLRFQLILLLGLSSQHAYAEISIQDVSRSHHPGEVILFVIALEKQPTSGLIRAFDQTFILYPGDEQETMEGLVGIDLDVDPGTYPVQFVLKYPDGERVYSRTIQVLEKEFPVRRLTVDEKFVTPPPEVLDRIQREAKTVRRILSQRTPTKLWQGEFLRPVPGTATSSFGKRSILNGKPRSPHTGTDFRAGEGTPVKAPNGGVVVLATELYYSGNVVILDHGHGLFSYFAHLSKINVAEGDQVQKGQTVGLVGATGRVTGPHLHWTLRLAESRVDPISLMEVLSMRAAQVGP